MLTDETALESNAETEGTTDLSSIKTGSNTEPQQGLQQGPQGQQGSDADGSAATADQQVNGPVLIILSFYSLNVISIFRGVSETKT